MRTPIVLCALILLGTAVAAPLPPPPTCTNPSLSPLCVRVVVGDIIVLAGQEEEYNNGTYVFQGTVTVEDGGRVEIILSDVTFGGEDEPITVRSGGTLVIESSDLLGVPTSPPVIVAEPGANVEVRYSDFAAIELRIETDDAIVVENDFRLGNPAIRLVGFSGTIAGDNTFHENVVAINATAADVRLVDLRFQNDGTGIELYQSNADVVRAVMENMSSTGIRASQSQGQFTNMFISDRAGPPTIGLDLGDTGAGVIWVNSSTITRWGTGMLTCNADVRLSGNVFVDNLQDFDTC